MGNIIILIKELALSENVSLKEMALNIENKSFKRGPLGAQRIKKKRNMIKHFI
jgi:hypothetical protein